MFFLGEDGLVFGCKDKAAEGGFLFVCEFFECRLAFASTGEHIVWEIGLDDAAEEADLEVFWLGKEDICGESLVVPVGVEKVCGDGLEGFFCAGERGDTAGDGGVI